jgi:hypothetical protein
MVDYTAIIKKLLSDPVVFIKYASGLTLRSYQEEVARSVANSVARRLGHTLVVMFPRQSGKNELQAQLETYFLMLFSEQAAEMVKVSPTWKPQAQNAMRRLERVLEKNFLTRDCWEKEAGYLYRLGRAQIAFFSGAIEANIVGATASLLLEVDEAQDVAIDKYDRDIAPMAASTNATRVLWGTAWTGDTLLARELKAAQAAEQRDGLKRIFTLTADEVAQEVPEYGRHVAEQVARLGRDHLMVRTQYFNQEIAAVGGLFDDTRRALMQGGHDEQFAPQAGKVYALTLDVGGAATIQAGSPETGSSGNHDSSAMLVVEIDLATLSDPMLRAPGYRIVSGRIWEGTSHPLLYGELRALVEHWHARHVVVDATGVGAGLAAFLEKTFPGRVIPFTFSSTTKSQLGWNFLSAIETGRFKLFRAGVNHPLLERLNRELIECRYELGSGAGRSLHWGAPPGSGKHDDLLIAAALAVVLDGQPWSALAGATIIPRHDPLEEQTDY